MEIDVAEFCKIFWKKFEMKKFILEKVWKKNLEKVERNFKKIVWKFHVNFRKLFFWPRELLTFKRLIAFWYNHACDFWAKFLFKMLSQSNILWGMTRRLVSRLVSNVHYCSETVKVKIALNVIEGWVKEHFLGCIHYPYQFKFFVSGFVTFTTFDLHIKF